MPTRPCRAAAEIGFPVVVKVADPTILHKTDRGLVRVGLQTSAEVAAAVDAFRAELGSDSVDVRVQPVLTGVEVACGVVRDPVFGPLVRIAAGGVATEIWKDEVYLVPPVTSADVGTGPARAAPVAVARRLPRQPRGSTWRRCSRSWWAWASWWSTYPRCRTSTSTRCSSRPTACTAST